jgi:thiosulfate reductase cytochrome b subunit
MVMAHERLYLYPVWVRLWHWFNAVMCLALILSGVSMQYSNPDFPMIRFDIAVTMHNIAGVLLTVSYLAFVIGNLTTGNGKYYRAKIKGLFKRLTKQFIYYTIGIFKDSKKPYPVTKKRKFNPMQKLSYIVIMYIFMPLIFITGWALLYPETIIHNVLGFSGLHMTGMLHILSGFVISVFMLVHIYFCTIGTTNTSNFKAMINGWHE